MKDYLSQCQQEQESFIDYKVGTTNKLYKKDLLANNYCAVQIQVQRRLLVSKYNIVIVDYLLCPSHCCEYLTYSITLIAHHSSVN